MVCPYCGCAVHVATNWIGLPKQKEHMSIRDFRAEVYPFCACAQAMESERLANIASRTEEWWAFVAEWYHEKIAQPDSNEHQEKHAARISHTALATLHYRSKPGPRSI